MCIPVVLGFKGRKCGLNLIPTVNTREDTYFASPALEFSTLLEVTEAGTIHINTCCTMPTRCTPVLLGFKGR